MGTGSGNKTIKFTSESKTTRKAKPLWEVALGTKFTFSCSSCFSEVDPSGSYRFMLRFTLRLIQSSPPDGMFPIDWPVSMEAFPQHSKSADTERWALVIWYPLTVSSTYEESLDQVAWSERPNFTLRRLIYTWLWDFSSWIKHKNHSVDYLFGMSCCQNVRVVYNIIEDNNQYITYETLFQRRSSFV